MKLSDVRKLKNRDAVNRLIDSRFDGDMDSFLDCLNSSINRLLATDLRKAKRLVDGLRPCVRLLPAKYKPNLIAMQARVSQWMGNHRQALKQYKQVSALFRKQRDSRAVALVGQGLMDAQMYLGYYDEAIKTGKKSLSYFRKKRMSPNVGKVLANIGNVYHRMDRNHLALAYYDKARTILAANGGVAVATVDFNRANIFANLNKLDVAAQLYKLAGDTYAKEGFHLFECKAKYSLAYLYFLKDEYAESLRTFEEVHTTFVKLGDRRTATLTQLDLAEVNLHLNQLGTAIHLGEEATNQFSKLGMQYESAKATYFIGIAHLKLGEPRLASRYLRRSARLFQQEKNDLWLGITSMALAQLSLTNGRIKAADEATLRAKRLFKKSGDRRRTSDADIHLVRIMLHNGDSAKGIRAAESLLTSKLAGYQVYDLQIILGQYYDRSKQNSRALDHFKRAVEILEKMVAGLHSDEIRFFFILDKLDAYKGVVDSLLHLGRYDSSFLSNLRALSIINERRHQTRLSLKRVPRRLLDERSELRASIKKLTKVSTGDQRSGTQSDTYYDSEQRLWSIERRIRTYSHRPVRDRVLDTELNSVAELLKPGESIVNFHATSSGSIAAFCGDKDNVTWIPLEISLQQLRAIVWELHFVVERAVIGIGSGESSDEAQRHYLRKLYRVLIKPLEQELSGNRLIVVADGVFAQVPFMALMNDGGTYFKDLFNLDTVVCPHDLRHRKRSTVRFKRQPNAIFGVPSETIPAVTAEVERIKSLFKTSNVFIGEEADCETLRKNLAQTRGFVHIATHASRSSENPLFSQIFMSDGPLYPFDLYAEGVGASLVTLSGCQTAAPGLYYGNSYTLAKAFHQAGSRYVLASLWPLADRHSAAFMMFFYEALASSGQVPDAYRSAIKQMSRMTIDPAFWSGFVLLGI
ncbi:MAG: CHAT domain-containing protein [candidate division Zixibacteria bacterium]|nr:CHAT domain-containing protein [candidate division Zixibacteria bacterium]